MERNGGKVKMDKNKKVEEKKAIPIFVKFGVIALVIIAALVGGMFIWFNAANGYAARIGNEKISVNEYKFYLTIQKENMLYQAQTLDPNLDEASFWNTKYEGETTLDIAKKSALEGIRDVKIQLAKAKESKISLTSEEMKNIDDGIKTNYIDPEQYGSGNRVKANKFFMDKYGFGIDDLKNAQVENAIVQKFQAKVNGERNIPEADLKKEYDKDTKMYDKVTVTHVLFLYAGKDNKRSKEDSKKLADDTLAKVKAGEDIKELAKKLSEDTGVTENSGVYTFTKYDNLVPEFIDWALKANVGDSGIVETTYGYHVMKLDKREPTPFNDVKDKIKAEISQSKYNDELTEWKKDAKYTIEPNTSVYGSIK